jgi:hypothetical protein
MSILSKRLDRLERRPSSRPVDRAASRNRINRLILDSLKGTPAEGVLECIGGEPTVDNDHTPRPASPESVARMWRLFDEADERRKNHG